MKDFIKKHINNQPTLSYLIGISVVASLLGLFLDLIVKPAEGSFGLLEYVLMPMDPKILLFRPWTLFTYAFVTPLESYTIWGLVLNLVFIFQFGKIFMSILGERKLRSLLIFAGLFNAILVILMVNLLPDRNNMGSFLFGLSTVSATLIAAVITLIPNFPVMMMLFGRVKILWIGLAVLAFKTIGTLSLMMVPEMTANLIGIGVGFAYVRLLRDKGINIPEKVIGPILDIDFPGFKIGKKPKTRLKIVKSVFDSTEDELNFLLDRISEVGYSGLSQEEKQRLAELGGK